MNGIHVRRMIDLLRTAIQIGARQEAEELIAALEAQRAEHPVDFAIFNSTYQLAKQGE